MLTTIQQHKKLFLVLGSFLFFIAFLLFAFGYQKQKQPIEANKWSSVKPGLTKEEMARILGQPLSESTNKDQTVSQYKSDSPTRNNIVTFQKGTSQIIRRIITSHDVDTVDTMIRLYGEPKYTLYGSDADAGFYLYIYPDKGVAYIGNPINKDLLEIWYFQPTSFEEFRKQFAPDYTDILSPVVQ